MSIFQFFVYLLNWCYTFFMLYTRKGDKGTTKVLDSKERFSKGSDMAEALGCLDELNSFLGLCRARARQVQEGGVSLSKRTRKPVLTSDILKEVQQNLFIAQAQLAGAPKKKIVKRKVKGLEKIVDAIEKEIQPLRGFSIAGGSELSALLDVARTVARRCERRVVKVHEAGLRKLTADTLAYLNRLSSLLFALARLSNHKSGIKEETPSYK